MPRSEIPAAASAPDLQNMATLQHYVPENVRSGRSLLFLAQEFERAHQRRIFGTIIGTAK